MAEGIKTLTYAVRGKVILKYLGQLALMVAALTLVPLGVSIYFGDYTLSYRYLIVIGLLCAYGFPTARLEVPGNLQINEALSIIALIFLISPLLMTIPVMGSGLEFADALFETVSAITTTGLTTLMDVESKPKTFLFARAWMQWYGGLGIIILSVALFMRLSIATRRLTEPLSTDSFIRSSRTFARQMLVVYLLLTTIAVIVVTAISGDFFLAITHVLTGVSTGGFSSFNNNLASMQPGLAQSAILFFTVFGAIPFPLFFIAWKSGFSQIYKDVELIGLFALILLFSFLLTILLFHQFGGDWQKALYHGVCMAVSAQTTTGFNTINVAEMEPVTKLIIIISMIVGGGTASSAGGIKILRLLIFFRLMQLIFQRTALPSHAVAKQSLGGRVLDNDELQRALLLIILFIVVIIVSWLIFLYYSYNPLDALFEVVSATATTGLSAGVTQHEMPTLLKAVLGVDMLLGRLEIIAFLVLLYPRNWFGKRA
jgi:trk system potassium uptake protein TrkH